MGESRSDEPEERRRALEDRLLRQAHERGSTEAERSPFWREGRYRCEFHKRPGDERLKVFSGERCVHEEAVQGSGADRRAQELRRAVQGKRPDRDGFIPE
jgi:hypothetical protein